MKNIKNINWDILSEENVKISSKIFDSKGLDLGSRSS